MPETSRTVAPLLEGILHDHVLAELRQSPLTGDTETVVRNAPAQDAREDQQQECGTKSSKCNKHNLQQPNLHIAHRYVCKFVYSHEVELSKGQSNTCAPGHK